MQSNACLHFNGQCEEAFQAYGTLLGGNIETMMRYEGSPMESHVPAEWRSKIMHGRLRIGDTIVMGSDAPPPRYQRAQGFSMTLSVDDPDETEHVFHGLADGGTVQMPLQKTFWAKRFGMLVDRFGIPWMVNCE